MMIYLEKAKGFLLNPDKAFNEEKRTDILLALKYMVILSLVSSILTAVLGANPLLVFVIVYVSTIVFNIIFSLWLHLCCYFFGKAKDMNQTMKSVFYGSTPTYLLGWIPMISIIFSIWSLVLIWKGLVKLQGMKERDAAISLIVAVAIPAIIISVFFLSFLTLLITQSYIQALQ